MNSPDDESLWPRLVIACVAIMAFYALIFILKHGHAKL